MGKNLLKKAESLDRLFKAIKTIEENGINGFDTASGLVGKRVSLALLIAYSRVERGSTESFPSDPKIDDEVLQFLYDKRLI